MTDPETMRAAWEQAEQALDSLSSAVVAVDAEHILERVQLDEELS